MEEEIRNCDKYSAEYDVLQNIMREFLIVYGFKSLTPLHDIAASVMDNWEKQQEKTAEII